MTEIKDEDVKWAARPVIGLVLLTAEIDSHGNLLESNLFYRIGKHLPTGNIIIIPIDDEETLLNNELKLAGQLN